MLGVDPHKAGVREIFARLVKSDYKDAFCIVKDDPKIPGNVRTKHGDGSGTKSKTRALAFLEDGNPEIFKGDIHDGLSMNASDVGACGFVYDLEVTDVINICPLNLRGTEGKKQILTQIAIGFAELVHLYQKYGITLDIFGGETADLVDPVSSIVLDVDVRSTMSKDLLIKGNVMPGDRIFGFSSAGKAHWEETENSGTMANGHTMATRVLLHKHYCEKYPFLFHADKPLFGRFELHDFIAELNMTIGEALLSPTRQWAILIRMLIDNLISRGALHLLHGICVNTGGGLSKCLHLGSGIHYIKNIPEPPPFFQLLRQESRETWHNMGTTFNCGIGIEIFGADKEGVLAEALIEVSQLSGIDLYALGSCESSASGKNTATVTMMGQISIYE